ncbi:tripartite tricarboxylate transporter substrate binding protein [Roseomonas sp. NAR14]|uniref:Tripartite tricarboxylate transporter substrate binding protein n=1 Tax=Roseomonas acroporae TaxID=2937791 RepID=A0A9X1Y797_9PROT|nr:tripartite tricarboxylate transporter substrate binding protein [Roseomonas acroporae]MCK8784417.1 tripartite tricarboxylate transporter substrate binding protein [Roseomonas acroporae]
MQRRMLLGAMLACAAAPPVRAEAWPERELILTVNYGAGGNTDAASRELAREMSSRLGRPMVVVNRPGALGTLGPAYVAQQKPDGYNVAVATYASMAIAPHMVSVSYGLDDFAFVGAFGRYRYGIVVRADSPYRTIQDLVAAARRGSVFFGAPSPPNNLALFELGRRTGARFEQATYRSGSEAVVALLGGQVEVIVQNPSDVLSQIESGKLRLLASASPVRWPEHPAVPTLREAGYDVAIDSWLGLAVPKGTPPAVVERLQAALQAATATPALRDAFGRLGVDPATMTGEEYRAMLVRDHAAMREALALLPTGEGRR